LLNVEKLDELNFEKTFYTSGNFYVRLKLNTAKANNLINYIRFLSAFLNTKLAKTIYNIK